MHGQQSIKNSAYRFVSSGTIRYKQNTISVTKLGRTEEVYLWQHAFNFSLQDLLEPYFIAQLHINI